MAADVVLVGMAAFGCGVVNSVAGGGTLLLFPALVSTGMGSLAANVTNAVSTLPGYVGGALGFREELRPHLEPLPSMSIAAATGAAVGSALLLVTPEAAFDAIVPILVALSAVLVGLQPWIKQRGRARRAAETRGVSAAGRSTGLVVAAVYGGYFGGGLGVILLAVLGWALPASFQEQNAVKTALSVVCAVVTVAVFGVFGPVRWEWVAMAAPMTLIGGYAGSRVARRIDESALRAGVVVVGLVVAAALALT